MGVDTKELGATLNNSVSAVCVISNGWSNLNVCNISCVASDPTEERDLNSPAELYKFTKELK